MRVVFAGTPQFAVPSLRALAAAGHQVNLVLTQPDRPAGRGWVERGSPVKAAAEDLAIPVYQPASLKSADALERIRTAEPEVMVVVAYGLILPSAALSIPRHGAINVHASLLPRWRGAAPIQRAILAGDPETGITLMQMDAGLDTGPILTQRSVPITADDTGGTLHDGLAALGATMLADLLRSGVVPPGNPQPAEGATYASKIGKAETAVNWALPAEVIARTARAFDPSPGAAATFGETPVKLWRMRAEAGDPSGGAAGIAPGTVLAVDGGIRVACGAGAVLVTEMQRPGGRRLPAAELLRGWTVRPGDRFA